MDFAKNLIAMDWTSIIVAAITASGAFIGVYFSNRKSAALIQYRLQELEKKVDRHNHYQDRISALEQFQAVQEQINKENKEAKG